MKTETHSTKTESRRDFEVFRKRLLAELQIHQDRVDRARNELPVDSDPMMTPAWRPEALTAK